MSNGRRARLNIFAVAPAAAVGFAPYAATQGVGELRVSTTRSIATVLKKIGADFERRLDGHQAQRIYQAASDCRLQRLATVRAVYRTWMTASLIVS